MRHIPTNSVTKIVPTEDAVYTGLTFSPDGNYVYYARQDKDRDFRRLYQIPVLGGTPRLVVTGVDSSITFSSDGRRFAFRRDSSMPVATSVMIADADGSHGQTLAQRTDPAVFQGSPSWSADGKLIAMQEFSGHKTGELGQFVALDVTTGREIPIAPFSRIGQVFAASWIPDGSGLLAVAGGANANWNPQIFFISYPAGQLRRITNDLNRYASVMSTTLDGRSLVSIVSEYSRNLWVMPASGSAAQATQISSVKNDAVDLDWTADGRVLSDTQNLNGFGFNLRNSDGSAKTTILSDTVPSFRPSACGDGRHIVFLSVRAQNRLATWQMDATGNSRKEITSGPLDQMCVCSPDGQWVAYGTFSDAGSIFRIGIDGGSPTRLTAKPGNLRDVSPDGKLVAFDTNEGSPSNSRPVWLVIPSTGGDPVYSIDADVRALGRPRFTPDGKALSYIVNEHGVSNIWAKPLAGGAPTQLTDFKSDVIFDFAWSRDGKQLALSRGQVSNDVVLLTDTAR